MTTNKTKVVAGAVPLTTTNPVVSMQTDGTVVITLSPEVAKRVGGQLIMCVGERRNPNNDVQLITNNLCALLDSKHGKKRWNPNDIN